MRRFNKLREKTARPPMPAEVFEARVLDDELFAEQWGDLGPVYDKQWRDFGGVDQIEALIQGLRTNPYSRRHLVSLAIKPNPLIMNLLPKNTPLGRLHLLDTHIFYDGPKLFTAKNASGQKYLSFWLGQSHDRGDKWLYIPVSTPRHKSILTGDISLREACLNPEDGWVWIIESGYDRDATSEMKLPGQIAESELPAEETFLKADDMRV